MNFTRTVEHIETATSHVKLSLALSTVAVRGRVIARSHPQLISLVDRARYGRTPAPVRPTSPGSVHRTRLCSDTQCEDLQAKSNN